MAKCIISFRSRHFRYLRKLSFLNYCVSIYASSKLLTEVHGFFFIPVLEMPNAFFITERKSDRERTIEMIQGVLELWPLLIICLLMALIAGGLIWVMDTWSNKVQALSF